MPSPVRRRAFAGCDAMADDAETEQQAYDREKKYWDNQKAVCDKLEPVDTTVKDIKAYIKEKEGSDPMCAPRRRALPALPLARGHPQPEDLAIAWGAGAQSEGEAPGGGHTLTLRLAPRFAGCRMASTRRTTRKRAAAADAW